MSFVLRFSRPVSSFTSLASCTSTIPCVAMVIVVTRVSRRNPLFHRVSTHYRLIATRFGSQLGMFKFWKHVMLHASTHLFKAVGPVVRISSATSCFSLRWNRDVTDAHKMVMNGRIQYHGSLVSTDQEAWRKLRVR